MQAIRKLIQRKVSKDFVAKWTEIFAREMGWDDMHTHIYRLIQELGFEVED